MDRSTVALVVGRYAYIDMLDEEVKPRAGVLLGTPAAAGTVAAARLLGQSGLNVSVLAGAGFSPAAWSRYAARSYSAPAEVAGDPFIERLLQIGKSEPGKVLIPTSDQTAWLYALHADVLQQYFQLYHPPIECLRRILDKQLFCAAAAAAGLTVLPTWDPENLEEVSALSATLPYPILIKPRTHVLRHQNDKGMVVRSRAELIERYAEIVRRESGHAALNPYMPRARLPILQQFVKVANEGVCSISGFLDRSGELFVTRRTTKVFLRSQPVGVGVCFESLPPDPALSGAVRDLCREIGYFGLFEVEFLRSHGAWAVIDFNPRLFNQVGLDIKRGMPLPLFAYLDAIGERASLAAAVNASLAAPESAPVFCDRFTLRMILAARQITGRIQPSELQHWRDWLQMHAGAMVDITADRADPMPGAIHTASEIVLGLRGLPRFLRLTPRTEPVPLASPVNVRS